MTDRARQEAERLLQTGHHERAIERFRGLLADSPSPELRGRLAEAYRLAGKVDRAFHHFDQAARSFSTMGHHLEAVKLLRRADGLFPGQPEVLFRLARGLEELGDDPDALREACHQLTQAARAPGDRRRLWALGCLAETETSDLTALRSWILSLLQAGREEEASAALVRRLRRAQPGAELLDALVDEVDPYPCLRWPLSERALAAGDVEGALAWLEPLIETKPNFVPARELMVRIREANGAPRPHRAALAELARALVRAEFPERAEPLVDTLLKDPNLDLDLVETTARLSEEVGRPHATGPLWTRLLEAHHAAEATTSADRAILGLLKAAPDHAPGLRAAARYLRATQRLTEAEGLERRLVQLDHETPTPHFQGVRAGDPDEDSDVISITLDEILEVADVEPEVSEDSDDLIVTF
ncbi:MAG: tetratricopeptide repeat protein [Myxococcota bacterium]